jgi:hypothetical protein
MTGVARQIALLSLFVLALMLLRCVVMGASTELTIRVVVIGLPSAVAGMLIGLIVLKYVNRSS